MSHELRTPLNSLLILAKLLSENGEGNLTDKQREFAETIHGAGSDLLNLINDILDLSKVEAGKMDVHVSAVPVRRVVEDLRRGFTAVAEQKKLQFDVVIDDDALSVVHTDDQRLQQVVKNLLSNAFKFTSRGSVTLRVGSADSGLAISVSDTGIGIPDEKLRVIFEAFQQADGTTSRRFGGTGLGLSISREISRVLGGEIDVASTAGAGSTFTLRLPERHVTDRPRAVRPGSFALGLSDASGQEVDAFEVTPSPNGHHSASNGNGDAAGDGERSPAATSLFEAARPEVTPVAEPTPRAFAAPAQALVTPDDREALVHGDRVLLIIEDDPHFASIVLETARERGFKGVVALRGDAGLSLAHQLSPDAIVLDIALPGTDGLEVLRRLKRHPETRHIPVHVISGHDHRRDVLQAGAAGYLGKPVTRDALAGALSSTSAFIDRSVRSLLLVEDDCDARSSIAELVGGEEDVDVVGVATTEEALGELRQRPFDCVVLGLGLPAGDGHEFLRRVGEDGRWPDMPVVVRSDARLTSAEEHRLGDHTEAVLVRDVDSPERLLDETSLFLHRMDARLPDDKRRMLARLHDSETSLKGKRVLVVDDDVRNVFALTNALEMQGMEVSFAENGREGLAALDADPDVDIVLMDVMMPEMDGYETMGAIRADERFTALPIIALTAKAMRGDREKSLAAGASDYITKPVETDSLLSMMRVWADR